MKGKFINKNDPDAKAFSTKYTRDIYVLKTKIAHVEDKIRITEIDKQKLKKLEKEKITKIEEEKKLIEENIDKCLKELNKKKEKIFNIQKPIVEKFKKNLEKLTKAYEESLNKTNQLLNGDDMLNSKKNELQNEGKKIKEMYDIATGEYNQLKEEAQEKLKEMNKIKEEYPKEYQYFQEKIKYFKKIKDLKEENKNINKQIKDLQKNLSKDAIAKNERNAYQKKLSSEKNRNQNKIEELKSGIALEQLENDLKKHNSDIFSWSYIKEIMIQYYGEKYYNETSNEYIDNLRNIWTNRINYIFNEEYLRTKKAKESRLETILNRLSELELNNKNDSDEAVKLNEESETLKEELNIDENDFNKVYSIFNDVILLLNQINDENKNDIFSNHFIESIININPDYNTMKEYSKKNFDRLINLYISELIEHSKSKKNLIMRNKKCDEFIEEKNNENLQLEDKIKTNNDKLNELSNKKQENLKEINKIQNLIDIKTTEIKKYLNELCEEKFKNYKEENSETLKNFNKIYGKKILTKANKVQKEKIYEDRINLHLQMKEKIENINNYINEYHEKNKELNQKISKFAENYQEVMDQADEVDINEDDNKKLVNKEEEKRIKLKEEMEQKVKEQKIKLKLQKEKLEKQENINYYIENLKKLNLNLNNIEKKKEKVFEQFSLFFEQVQKEQLKLQEQSHQLKLQLLEFKTIEDDNAFGSKVKMNNPEEINNNNINEEEKNNYEDKNLYEDRYEENEEENEIRKLKNNKSKNKLEIPEVIDVFAVETKEINSEIEIPEIDMYNQKLKPLFEGTKIYKRFSEKAVKTEYEEYDPIKNKGILPEAYDYCLRKLYANINEKQFEFFTIDGLPKKEAILPFNHIIGIRYSDNAKKIIKLKEETPQTGTKTDFIGRDNIPFSIMTKKSNWDIVCPEYISYVAIKTMIDTILSQPKPKNKIEIGQIPYVDNENDNDNNINYQDEEEEQHYEEYYE